MNEQNMRVEDIVHAITSRFKLIIGITLISAIVSSFTSFFLITPKYEASTKLFIGKEGVNESYSSSEVQMYQKLLDTYSNVIKTKDLVNRSLERTDLNLTVKDVLSNLSVEPKNETQIMDISYVSADRFECMYVVEAITNEFIETSKDLISNSNVKVIETVSLPENPISPNKKLNITVATILGLMVGLGISIIMEYMDNTFKSKEQVESIMGIPVLGAIPNCDEVN